MAGGDDKKKASGYGGALEGETFHADFRGERGYGDYLELDTLLNLQNLWSGTHDEMLFMIIHQANELWMKLALHELRAALELIKRDELRPAFKMFARVKRIQENMTQSWEILTTMTPADYMRFRDKLGNSSGFQSFQYRSIEFILGNKNPGFLEPHKHAPQRHDPLKKLLEAPSLYDEVIRLLARRGFTIDADQLERDWRQPRKPNDSVRAAWTEIYRQSERFWDLYELAEGLMDLEDKFQTWRFRHRMTVERVIGFKRGTGGTSGVGYLEKVINIRFFPEIWDCRTVL